MTPTGPFQCLAGALLATAAAGALQAQTPRPNHLYSRFQLSAAFTRVELGSTIRVDPSDGSEGTEFDGGDVGRGKGAWEPRFALRWQPGRRHELEVGYLFARTSGERVLVDTIAYGDTSFAAGLRVNSALQSDNASLGYRFAIHASEHSRIGLGISIGALLFKSSIDAVAGATAGGADTAIVEYGVSKSVTAPLATLGAFGQWRVGDAWYLEADARALYVPVDRITAKVAELGAAVRYFPHPSIGLELGYGLSAVRVDLDPRADGGGLAGMIRYTLQNFRLSVIATR
jgi:hypothetical protein